MVGLGQPHRQPVARIARRKQLGQQRNMQRTLPAGEQLIVGLAQRETKTILWGRSDLVFAQQPVLGPPLRDRRGNDQRGPVSDLRRSGDQSLGSRAIVGAEMQHGVAARQQLGQAQSILGIDFKKMTKKASDFRWMSGCAHYALRAMPVGQLADKGLPQLAGCAQHQPILCLRSCLLHSHLRVRLVGAAADPLGCALGDRMPQSDRAATQMPEPPPLHQPRPRQDVPFSQRRFVPRPVVDVHGRRRDVALAAPHPKLQQVAEWLTPAFYVDLGRPCNSACLYCAVPPHEDAQGFLPLAEVASIVAAGAQGQRCDKAILIGGEPTIYPQLNEVLDLLAEQGLSNHVLMTNGLRLGEPGVLGELRARGVATVHLSIDTLDPHTYDLLSRSTGKLAKQVQALQAILRSGDLNCYLYTAVTALNLATLPDLLRGVAKLAQAENVEPPPVILALIKPLGDALRHAEQLLVDPVPAAQRVAELVQLGDSLGIAVGHRNLAACLAPQLVDRNVDYYLDDYSIEVNSGSRLPFSHVEHWFHLPACQECGHRGICPGLYRGNTERFGADAYRPIGNDGLKLA